jgi:hypothetical protein
MSTFETKQRSKASTQIIQTRPATGSDKVETGTKQYQESDKEAIRQVTKASNLTFKQTRATNKQRSE